MSEEKQGADLLDLADEYVKTSSSDRYWELRRIFRAIPVDAPEQLAALKNKLTLANASCEAAGSLLLEVQGDCIDQRQRAGAAERERDEVRAELARLREGA